MDYSNRAPSSSVFGCRLTNLMTEGGIKNAELAREIGITNATVGKYKEGSILPSVSALCSIARFFHVSCDYLLGLADVSSPDITVRTIGEMLNLDEESYMSLLRILSPDLYLEEMKSLHPDAKYDSVIIHHEIEDIFTLCPPNAAPESSCAMQTISPPCKTIMQELLKSRSFLAFIYNIRNTVAEQVDVDALNQYESVYPDYEVELEIYRSERSSKASRFELFELINKIVDDITAAYESIHKDDIDAAVQHYRALIYNK